MASGQTERAICSASQQVAFCKKKIECRRADVHLAVYELRLRSDEGIAQGVGPIGSRVERPEAVGCSSICHMQEHLGFQC
ncbi:MAG: hypothetical protein FRX49_01966 [Trebouxia sp. A1-2]|nr:MAG: hypothetical protein FRX49_01966 [Trebouxia sp. A1-2]